MACRFYAGQALASTVQARLVGAMAEKHLARRSRLT